MDILGPYLPTLTLFAGAGTVIGATRAFMAWMQGETERSIKAALAQEREKLLTQIAAEIAGEREQTRAMVQHEIRTHEQSEQAIYTNLRDLIGSYHREALQAMEDAKRLAIRVSDEYQRIRVEVTGLRKDLEALEQDVRELQP